jgi:zinc protease
LTRCFEKIKLNFILSALFCAMKPLISWLLRKRFLFAFVLGLFVLIATDASAVARAQNVSAPRREQLLNGLKIVILPDAKSDKITVKLRVHAGSAFDPAGKTGAMRLLADNLFPEEGTRQFFEEDLGGSLNVESNYDFIQITASARAGEFEQVLDAVRTAVINPPITPETFKKLRDARLKEIAENSKKLENLADDAVRRHLFGDFPYGRALDGTNESLAKLDHFDLIFARDRFLTADNSTLVIAGNVKEAYAIRAAKQLFGAWRKSDKLVPATFRQPEAPDARIVVVDVPEAERAEIRIAVRGFARNDKDALAAELWAKFLEKRWQASMPENVRSSIQISHETHVLPGILLVRAAAPTASAVATLNILRESLAKAATEKPDAAQFAVVQNEVLNAIKNESAQRHALAERLLDAETFKMPTTEERANLVKNVTAADLERAAAKLLKDAPRAVVIAGIAEQIEAQIDASAGKK